MAKNCITEKTAQRQRWIENGLLEMMLNRKYEDINVTDLCSHLQLSRRSFYRYFDSLDDVLNSLMDHTFQQMPIASMKPSIQDLESSYRFWVGNRELLDALRNGGMIQKLFDVTLSYTDFYNAGAERNGIEKDRQVFVIGGFVSLIISWYMDGFRKTPEEMARISYDMLYESFLKVK